MLRARSATAGNRTWVAATRCSSARPTVTRSASAGGASVSHWRSRVVDHGDVGGRAPLGQEDPEDRVLQLRRAVQARRRRSGPAPGPAAAEASPTAPARSTSRHCRYVWKYSRGLCTADVGLRLLAGGPVAAQLAQVGEHAAAARPLRPSSGRSRRARPARPGSSASRRRSSCGSMSKPSSRLRRSAGHARPARPRARRRLGRQLQVDRLGRGRGPAASSSSPIGSRRSSGRRSPPGCRPTTGSSRTRP